MSGAKPSGLSQHSWMATGAAFLHTGDQVPRTTGRSTAIRCSRSARSQKYSRGCCLPTWCCGARWRRTIPLRNSFLLASRCRTSKARRSPCWISRPTRPACRGCRPISRRAEAGAGRASSEGQRALCGVGLVRRLPVRRRSGRTAASPDACRRCSNRRSSELVAQRSQLHEKSWGSTPHG